MLAADDAFMVHDYWMPRLTGARRSHLPGPHLYRGSTCRPPPAPHPIVPATPLLLIGAGFATSLLLDVAFDVLRPFRAAAAVEDIPKLWAVVLLAVVCVRERGQWLSAWRTKALGARLGLAATQQGATT